MAFGVPTQLNRLTTRNHKRIFLLKSLLRHPIKQVIQILFGFGADLVENGYRMGFGECLPIHQRQCMWLGQVNLIAAEANE